ncbi:hypothetical protein Q8F55_007092 [Vanrija albida]|uniref:Putative sensor domain-containing protein n=1 Tax=Vanrija albida TaxID=181172 RepID=A0ABR3PYX7_9TREE
MGTDAALHDDVVARGDGRDVHPDAPDAAPPAPPPPPVLATLHSPPYVASASNDPTAPHTTSLNLNLHLTMNTPPPPHPPHAPPPAPSHPTSPVYVLSADGSSLFLVDASKAPGNEAPPAYAPFDTPRRATLAGAARPPPSPVARRSASDYRAHEGTPLLPRAPPSPRPLRTVLYGDDDVLGAPSTPASRYWRTLGDAASWSALVHTLLLSFPLALALWPLLLAGTLVGTALLITLPLGAVLWWLTLLLARWAARVELRTQARFHGGRARPHPVFARDGEAGFLKLSWAMLSDAYSYSALSYFLLVKPLVVLPSFVALVVLFPLALVFTPLLPVFLRANRRFGRWQARVAVENLS